MDKIAVLIPCYNESKTIKKVVEDFKSALPEATIYVYDNNSKDETDKIAKDAGAIVRYERKQGKGNVIRTMFREIDAECYIMTDGDDTYPAEYAREMCNAVLERNVDMVIGDRLSSTYFTENKRPFHNTGNVLVRKLINMIYKSDIRDVMTGYRAFSYEFVKTFPILSKGFEIETEMTIHTLDKNMGVENIIIEYRDRPDGSESKLNTYSDGFKVIKTIVKLYKNYKPFSFFTWLSVFLCLVGTVFLLPVLIDYVQTGLVPKMPSFVASIFFFICGIQSFFGGLVLQTIVNKGKQDFEIKLNEYEDKFKNLKK
ncbi:MAG: glycosyltransferase [Clostridia bacterium]|nr:glycosyltransferase [Clostridia bacterium]MBR3255721.1 glycosyltransferase [Clostridia bacterium]